MSRSVPRILRLKRRQVVLALIAAPIGLLTACEQQTTPRRRTTVATSTATLVEQDENTIHIKNFEFVPVRLTVPVGTEVVWINDDGTNHIITDKDLEWRVGILPPGGSGSFQFDNPGEHTYVCSIHANERGTLIVE